VDSPITVAETALKRGVKVIGKDVDISDRAGDAWLTGVSWNWGPMMVDLVKAIDAGTWEPSHVRGDLATGHAVLDPFGASVPEDVQKKTLALKDKIVAGDLKVFSGPIVKQDGTTAVPAGEGMTMDAIETMDFLVKGVNGTTG
jgi:basic membrane lipoprotein Med (substrate-binding protein (PBP1-ABC) superfamily)